MNRALALVLLVVLSGCAGDEPGDPIGIHDTGLDARADATPDSSVTPDAADATPEPDAVVDAAPDAVVDATPDATPDVVTDAAKLRGQCWSDAQCTLGQTCAVEAPGGICNGCGVAGDCKAGSTLYSCTVAGACSKDCSSDADCARGMQCKTSIGICGLKACSAQTDCASGTECRALAGGSNKYCQRYANCTATSCPVGYACKSTGLSSPSSVCVENDLDFP